MLSLFIFYKPQAYICQIVPSQNAIITVQSISESSVTLNIPINFKQQSLVHMCGNWCHILIRLALHHLKLIIARITNVIYRLTVPQHQEINQLWTAVSGLSSGVRAVIGRSSHLLGGCALYHQSKETKGHGGLYISCPCLQLEAMHPL